jgi:E3 ubiquitin-protein ligase BRE1
MHEYKKQKNLFEAQLKDVRKRVVDHEDHMRIVDAWWSQLLDEINLLAKSVAPSTFEIDAPFPTATSFGGSAEFSEHLASKAKEIKQKVNGILASLASSQGAPSPDVQELREKFAQLLAAQKAEMVKFDNLRTENAKTKDELQEASLRAIKAEKKLERAKSATVAKMEQQAIAGTGNSAGSGIGGVENGYDNRAAVANGTKDDSVKTEASDLAFKETIAISEVQKKQLDDIMAENKSLAEQLTTANARLANLTDEDYARTELFKTFRTQHEEVIKRINHLEATHIQLRTEAEKLQAEREAYRAQIREEADALTKELEAQVQRIETDLTRIRSQRDELHADQSVRKATQDQERTAIEQMKELVGAKEDRITSLETEIQRLQAAISGATEGVEGASDINNLGIEELRQKYLTLEQSFASINNEMPAMEKAYKRAVATAGKKVMDFAALEERCSLLIAEKAKADQKYFAARKDMDTRMAEIRSLKNQNSKSSEIITSLKEVESSNKRLLSGLEKEVTDLKQANTTIMMDHKKLQNSSMEATAKLEQLKVAVAEIQKHLKEKDASLHTAKSKLQEAEIELEKLRTRYEHIQKERDNWKNKSLSNQSGEEEMLRVSLLISNELQWLINCE